jgi:hypothetical protein
MNSTDELANSGPQASVLVNRVQRMLDPDSMLSNPTARDAATSRRQQNWSQIQS